jgi:hypothetical protein
MMEREPPTTVVADLMGNYGAMSGEKTRMSFPVSND